MFNLHEINWFFQRLGNPSVHCVFPGTFHLELPTDVSVTNEVSDSIKTFAKKMEKLQARKSTSTLVGEIQVRRRMDENGGLKVGVLPLSPLKTDMSPENWWLEDEISFWDGPFLCDMLIFGGGFYLALTIFKTDGPVTKTTPAKMH